MTSANTNSDSGITNSNNTNKILPQFIPIIRNLGACYRERPASIFPLNPMSGSISIVSSENQLSGFEDTKSTIDLTSTRND